MPGFQDTSGDQSCGEKYDFHRVRYEQAPTTESEMIALIESEADRWRTKASRCIGTREDLRAEMVYYCHDSVYSLLNADFIPKRRLGKIWALANHLQAWGFTLIVDSVVTNSENVTAEGLVIYTFGVRGPLKDRVYMRIGIQRRDDEHRLLGFDWLRGRWHHLDELEGNVVEAIREQTSGGTYIIEPTGPIGDYSLN
jgi:hypothetical protein